MPWAWLALTLAWSAPPSAVTPTCDTATHDTPPTRLSVVWLSPSARMATGSDLLTVVPARALRDWIARENAGLPRVLSGLGLKGPRNNPTRPWRAVIFEVDRDQLCRPMAGAEPGSVVSGVAVCPHADRHVAGQHDSCGHAIDRLFDRADLPVFHVRWRDASTRGFCVLPAERFVRGE